MFRGLLLIHLAPLCFIVSVILTLWGSPPGAHADDLFAQAEETPGLTDILQYDYEKSVSTEKDREEGTTHILPEIKTSDSDKEPTLSILPSVFVSEFRFEGNTVFPDEELGIVAEAYKNREITFEELQRLRQELTLYYIDRGFVNSGVIIPDQAIQDGVVTFKIIEGRLSRIEVEGNTRLSTGYISRRLRLAEGPPVNIYSLQKAFQILQQDPRIRRINAEFVPGILPGESILKVRIEEENPFNVWVDFNNNHSPSIGSYGLDLHVIHKNVTGRGDTFEGSLEVTEGLNDLDLYYIIPITARDTILKFQIRQSNTTVVEEPFEDLDIESESATYGITASHPVYRTPSRIVTMGVTGEIRNSETTLLGRKFSFTEGVDDGETDITVIRFFQEWLDRNQSQVLAVRSTFSFGIDAFGATISSSEPDGRFFAWLGQFQWIRRLGEKGSQVHIRADMQLSDDPLLPIEKFSVGGMDSVRGYRKNRLVRDKGITASLEFRIPVFRNKQGEGIVYVAPFIDYGRSWNSDRDTPDPEEISSAGLGLRWDISRKVHFQVYGGVPFEDFDDVDDDLQDVGIHFSLIAQLF